MSTIDSIKPNTNNKPITVKDFARGRTYTRTYQDDGLTVWACEKPGQPSSYCLTFLDSGEDLATDGPEHWLMTDHGVGLADALRTLADDLGIDAEALGDDDVLKEAELVAHAANAFLLGADTSRGVTGTHIDG